MMRTYLLILTVFLSTFSISNGQQKDFQWRLGVSGGYSNYYGDLSPRTIKGFSSWESIHHLLYFNENYFEKPSFKISLERQLTPTVGLMLNYGEYHFTMSDRYIRRNGEIWLNAPNFSRGLNFQNESRDMGLALVFKADNDRLLSSRSWIAPYFTLGVGRINFDVKGDLLDAEGQRYDYTLLGPIHDGIYETSLPSLNTESDGGYKTVSFYTNLGLGFRIKLGKRLELFAQSDLMYTFTDYLDDVSGNYRTSYDNDFQAYAAKPGTNSVDPENPYRGNPDLGNDWIIYHGLGLKFNFGASKKSFSAPRLSTYIPQYQALREQSFPVIKDSTVKNLPDNIKIESLETELAKTIRKLDSTAYITQLLNWEQQIAQKENNLRAIENKRKSLLEIDRVMQSQIDSLNQNKILDTSTLDSLSQWSKKSQFNLRYSLDSISRREKEFLSEIDSIAQMKQRYSASPSASFGNNTISSSTPKDTIFIFPEKEEKSIVAEQKTTEKDSISGILKTEKSEVKTLPSAQSERSSRREESVLSNADQQDELKRLQQENQYLRYQRDQLLTNLSNAPSTSQRRDNSSGQVVYERQTITDQRTISETEIKEKPKRRWWWPFGAGAAVGSIAVSSLQSESKENSTDESVFIQNELREIKLADSLQLKSPLADSLVRLDLKLLFSPEVKDSLTFIPIKEKLDLEEKILQDTVFAEGKERIRILPSKVMVFFKVNQRTPDKTEIEKLTEFVDFVKNNPEYQLVLSGFADNTGNLHYN
ncbi:MAG: hypothetical protein LPJ98_06960, partial [Cyclobacteriaceae bacterium]|nr:hypothetical protein [Cyclobacteriaceae bacterium]